MDGIEAAWDRAAPAPARLDVGFLAREVLARWPIILLLLSLGAFAGQRAQALFKPVYTSAVDLMIEPRRPNSFGPNGDFANTFVDNSKVASVALLMTSAYVLGRVVDKERLAEDPEFGAPFLPLIERLLPFATFLKSEPAPDTAELRRMRALYRLGRAVRTTRVGITYLITVQVSARSPELARQLATALVDAYLQGQRDIKVETARGDAEWMTQQTRELRAALLASEEEVETLRQKYGFTETDRAPNSTVSKQFVTDLNTLLSQADAELAGKQARYDEVKRLRATGGSLESLPEVTASHVIGELRLSLAEATKKYQAALRDNTPAYNAMSHAGSDVKQIGGQLAAEAGRIAEGITSDYQTSLKRRNALAAQLAAVVREQQSSNGAEGRVKLREAMQAAETNRALYEQQFKLLREVEQQQTRQPAEARVISPAWEPDRPSFPKPLVFTLGGGALGFVTGTGIAALLALSRGRRARPENIEQILGLPVLAKVPRFRRGTLPVAAGRLPAVDYLVGNPLSPFADSMRFLRNGLRTAVQPRSLHVLLVTSPLPGEGKSTIAAAAAVSNAMAGRKTVLVDVDLRNSSVSDAFRLPAADRRPELPPQRSEIAIMQPFRNLPFKVVSAGVPGRPRPDMISSPQFRDFIRILADEFDLVVLDSPPVLCTADAVALADLADASILIAEAQGTPMQLLQEAAKLLRGASAPLAGIVINNLHPKYMREYYGAYSVHSDITHAADPS